MIAEEKQTSQKKVTSETRKTITTCIFAQAVGAPLPQVLINGGILSLFILELGGSKFAVGSVFTMNYLAQLVRVLVSPRIDTANRKRLIIIWTTIAALVFSLIFLSYPLSIHVSRQAAVWLIVALFLFQRLSMNIAATAWFSFLTVVIPGPLRGRFFGRMRMIFQIVSLSLILFSGWYLGKTPGVGRFYVIFAVLFAVSLVRPLLLLRLPSPAPDREGRPEPVLRNIMRPLQDKPWRDFILFWVFLAFTVNIVRPFAVPFLKQDLAFPSSITTYASGAFLLGMVVALMPWGRLADRLGNRIVLLLNVLLMAVAFVILAVTPHYDTNPPLAMAVGIAAFLVTGISIGGLGIGHTVRQMHAAPPERRSAYMSLFFTSNGIISGIATLLSGAFLDRLPAAMNVAGIDLSPTRVFFVGSAILVSLTILLLWRLEPVSEKHIRYTMVDFLALLPPSLTVPLRLVNLDPHKKET